MDSMCCFEQSTAPSVSASTCAAMGSPSECVVVAELSCLKNFGPSRQPVKVVKKLKTTSFNLMDLNNIKLDPIRQLDTLYSLSG